MRAAWWVFAVSVALPTGCAQAPAETTAAATQPPPSASSSPPPPPALDSHTRGWTEGAWTHYQVQMTTTLVLTDPQNPIRFGMVGSLAVVPIAVTPDKAILFATLREATSTVKPQTPTPSDLDKVPGELRGADASFVLSGGRLAEVRIPRGIAPAAANAYREIVSALQFARTIDPADTYSAEEYDAAGRYVATYEVDPGSGGLAWHKRKTRYLALLGQAPAMNLPLRVLPEIVASDWSLRFSADGHPEAVKQRDEIRINGAQVPVHGTTTISLDSQPTEGVDPAPPDWTALLGSTVGLAASEPYGGQPAVEALDDARIHGMTFDTVVGEFERLAKENAGLADAGAAGRAASASSATAPQNEKQLGETQRLFEALSAIFRRHPETIALAVKRIDAKSAAAPMLIAALGSASSPASHAALIQLMNSKTLDPQLRMRATTALVRTPRPDQASVDALVAKLESRPFDTTALYGLGTFSRRMRDAGDQDKAKVLGELLVSRLSMADSVSTRIVVLGAIANSGYVGALSQVVPYLGDGREDVRSAAVQALQSMAGADVDSLVASRLDDDSSSQVRLSAIDAARARQPTDTLAHALVVAATNADDPRVRYRAVELMSAWLAQRPDLRPTLSQVAEKDTEGRIRDRARVAL